MREGPGTHLGGGSQAQDKCTVAFGAEGLGGSSRTRGEECICVIQSEGAPSTRTLCGRDHGLLRDLKALGTAVAVPHSCGWFVPFL